MPENELGTALVLECSTREFRLQPSGAMVTARTLQPSKPHGVWAGNEVTVRQWRIFRHVYSEDCTKAEIVQLEKMLGEWKRIDFIYHPGLRLVSIEYK